MPVTMEALPLAHGGRVGRAGQRHGFLLYTTTLPTATSRPDTLRLPEVASPTELFASPTELSASPTELSASPTELLACHPASSQRHAASS